MEMLFPVEGPLSSSQTGSLLEAGLTYVLYQRGQIPLPYQQLQVSAFQLRKKLELDQVEKGLCGALGSKPEQGLFRNGDESLGTEGLNPRERISTVLMERKKRLQLDRMERQKRQAIEAESKAYNSLQPAFEVLQRIFSDVSRINLGVTNSGHGKKIVSTALVLGPSLYSPKEIYCFDLPFPWISDESTLISKLVPNKFENGVLRQFYKKLITNGDLMDFTSKPLAKTYAHICLVTLGDLNSVVHGNSYYKDVIRLPTIPPALFHHISQFSNSGESMDTETTPESSLLSPPPRPFAFSRKRRPTNKCFKIKIHSGDPDNYINQESIESTVHSSSDSFSGDILFDNNSFSCYQIPLRFKGVQCKNKRL